jgi:threonine aldolase
MILLDSDTETKPSKGMRKAMYFAKVGDEQKGTDPTVRKLLKKAASLLGKEKALFLPTGTMCNLLSIKVHTNPSEVIIADSMSHILRAESAGFALSSGIMVESIETDHGIFTKKQLTEVLNKIRTVPEPYSPKPKLISIEQTHNLKGGTIWSLEQLNEINEIAKAENLKIHMDGARLFNAVVASETSAAEFCSFVDSVWIDFTKGLGAPMGAVLAGDADFIERSRHAKHAFGGAMRQAGIIAAGCLYALENNIERLQEDHNNAKYFAEELQNIAGIEVRNIYPESNMVFFRPNIQNFGSINLKDEMLNEKVKINCVGNYLRAVTHLDINRKDIEKSLKIITNIMKRYKSD